MAMAERKNIEFGVEGGVTLRGWLFVPGAKGPAPAITMAHGYAVRRNLIQEIVTLLRDGILVRVHFPSTRLAQPSPKQNQRAGRERYSLY